MLNSPAAAPRTVRPARIEVTRNRTAIWPESHVSSSRSFRITPHSVVIGVN